MRILVDGQTLATPEANRGIGVYFKNVLNAMIENNMTCEWFIAVPDEQYLKQLKPWVNTRIRPIVRKEFDPNHIHREGYIYQDTFSKALQEEMSSKQIDVYWNPNPLMTNVLFPFAKLPGRMVVTIHDLIPMIFADQYLKEWPVPVVVEYRERLRRIGDCVDGLIFDSWSAQQDFHKFVPRARTTGNVVYLGVEPRFQVTPCKSEYSTHPYVLFTGGFDYRKNMEKALEAFARLVHLDEGKELTRDLNLVIVCAYSPEAKASYEKLARSLGVIDRLIITGYISDFELQKLYQNCSIFFFPSLYEGFGLPVLEAMASGVPVVISNVSALPEVGVDHAYYFEPTNVDDMAKTLLQALKDDKERVRRVRAGIIHARQFTWTKTAIETLKVIHQIEPINVSSNVSKLTLAYVSPLPPQRTGIANYYSKHLLPYLARYFDIDVFVDRLISNKTIEGVRRVYPLVELEARCRDYNGIIYHLGNNSEFHKGIYDLAWRIPGIIVLHDYNLHPFLQHAYLLKGNDKMYQLALEEGYGKEGADYFFDVKASRQEPDIWKYPMSHAIVKRSRATIVHHHWVRAQYPHDIPVYVIPLFALAVDIKHEQERGNTFRTKYGIGEQEFVIGCYGFVNANKRPEQVVRAICNLRQKGYPVRLIFAGELSPSVSYLLGIIKELGIHETVILTGYLNDDEYYEALAAADVVVNLRYPSMGEASATLVEAITRGKAVVVSRVNQYMEFPDKVCWKVDIGDYEIDLLSSYLETLLKDRLVRESLGLNGQEFADNVIGIEAVAEEYFRVITEVVVKSSVAI